MSFLNDIYLYDETCPGEDIYQDTRLAYVLNLILIYMSFFLFIYHEIQKVVNLRFMSRAPKREFQIKTRHVITNKYYP